MESNGVILRKLRELKRLKIKEAAALIGRGAGWLCEVENGKGNARLFPSEFDRIVELYGGNAYKNQFGGWVKKAKAPPIPIQNKVFSGAILKYLRKKAKLTLLEATQRTGISRTHISAIETGRRNVPNKIRDTLMEAYGYSPVSFRNFATEDKRAKNIPTRYKLDLLLLQMDELRIQVLFNAAKKILDASDLELKKEETL